MQTIQPETIQPVLQHARFERKIGIGVTSCFKVACGRATRLLRAHKALPSVSKLATRWSDCGGHYYWQTGLWLNCLHIFG